jgi:hypothetical protein
MTSAPLASLSLDLDNRWSYQKTHGDAGWETFPSYLDAVVPRFLKVLDDLGGLKITVFVVGQDAALPRNHEALRLIPAAGHRLGNHSFRHEPWLHLYTPDQVRDEIVRTEDALGDATGIRPVGWRGPGFSYAPAVLRALAERGYRYDASTFPNYIGPLARAYYFMTSSLQGNDRQDRNQLFGRMREGLLPLRPYLWRLPEHRELLEIPVTTVPGIKTPFHLSYLLYLATFSPAAARAYFATALRLCRLARVEPSFLLHPLDFLGRDDAPELAFFPAMNRDGAWKTARSREFLRLLARSHRVVTMEDHADAIRSRGGLRHRPGPVG